MVDAFANHQMRIAGTHMPYRDSESDLSNQINIQHYLGWSDSSSMVEWVYGTPQGVKGHPLEEGHRMIADKIIKHIETQW